VLLVVLLVVLLALVLLEVERLDELLLNRNAFDCGSGTCCCKDRRWRMFDWDK